MSNHRPTRAQRALRTAGFTCILVALAAGLTLSWLAPQNGGWLVALVLVLVGIRLVQMAGQR